MSQSVLEEVLARLDGKVTDEHVKKLSVALTEALARERVLRMELALHMAAVSYAGNLPADDVRSWLNDFAGDDLEDDPEWQEKIKHLVLNGAATGSPALPGQALTFRKLWEVYAAARDLCARTNWSSTFVIRENEYAQTMFSKVDAIEPLPKGALF